MKAGAALARLRDDEQRAAVDQAQAALREAEARVAQLGSTTGPIADQQLRQAQANLELAQSEYGRVKQLFESGFFSQAKLDEAERNLATSKAQVSAATRQAEAARPKGSDASLALARQAQAAAALEVAKIEARLHAHHHARGRRGLAPRRGARRPGPARDEAVLDRGRRNPGAAQRGREESRPARRSGRKRGFRPMPTRGSGSRPRCSASRRASTSSAAPSR